MGASQRHRKNTVQSSSVEQAEIVAFERACRLFCSLVTDTIHLEQPMSDRLFMLDALSPLYFSLPTSLATSELCSCIEPLLIARTFSRLLVNEKLSATCSGKAFGLNIFTIEFVLLAGVYWLFNCRMLVGY